MRSLGHGFSLGTGRGAGSRDGFHEFLADVDPRVPWGAVCPGSALSIVLGAAPVARLAPVAFLGPSRACRECRARLFICTYTAVVCVQCNLGAAFF